MTKKAFLKMGLLVSVALLLACETVFAKTTPAPVSVDADSAFKELKAGNERFLNGKVRKDGQSPHDVQRLSNGQAPNSIVVSCSDSRVPPEIIFDQKLGEMFTVRAAGESLSPQSIGSAEFAIEKLGSHLLVVLGHTNCGAVKAAVDSLSGDSLGSANLDNLVADIQPRIRASVKDKLGSKNLEAESWSNALGVAKDLVSRSKLISDAVKSGRVKIVVGLYDLSSGSVTFDKK